MMQWQIRMFFSQEPEIPEEIKDLLWDNINVMANERIIEAFRRGKAGR